MKIKKKWICSSSSWWRSCQVQVSTIKVF